MNRPKRLQDASFIDNPIYRRWPPEYKCLWHFINADCDLNGVWIVNNFDIAQFTIYGSNKNELCLEKAKGYFKFHILEIDNGKRWFIPDFIKTQYGNKLSRSNFHNQITRTLLKYNIDLNKYGITSHPLVSAKNKYPTKDLADPRWKKKRHSILERDNFECQMCQGE